MSQLWKIQAGDRVLVEQAWEDEAGNYHDEYATVTHVRDDGSIDLKFDERRINEFLRSAEFKVSDVQKV